MTSVSRTFLLELDHWASGGCGKGWYQVAEGIQCPDSLNPCLDRRPMGGSLVCSGNRAGGALDGARSMPHLSSIVSGKCSGGTEPELSTLGPSILRMGSVVSSIGSSSL